ncbi:hypothetical protein HYPSUDRAFT_206477 [Hypholoma sublateritium FD-334 SS-4]|uniref:Fungal-type protein kinase domain-containing protein n=1 Tax=Hypholoma sublateritium (strain FD-334 SS-4) TaxID=945553 RepID=A0A0D2NKM5_HYPSF|nr:hypothetical protein HYPSUDRAFT_206477 [Hypholoma sublateritium FD-334 SS-4]
MSTPTISRSASSNSANADLMKALLRKDVEGHILREVDIKTFVTEVWGLSAATISTISESKLHTSPNVELFISDYNTSILNREREPALHFPFRKLAGTLVASICQTLGLDVDQAITTEFWDNKGNGELSSNLFFMHDRRRKPDMLDMFKQTKGYKPEWDDVRCSFEFKKKDARVPAPDPIAESEDVARHLSPSSGASSSSGVVATHSEGLYLTNAKERTTSGGTARRGLKRPHSQISDAHATSTTQNNTKRRRIAVNGDDAQLFTYALECLATGSRHYTTGFLIDKSWITIWYFDRTAVQRTTTFDFSTDDGILSLGLSLFALSQCTMKQAGFDPYLYKLVTPQPGKPITERSVLPFLKPSASPKEKCYMFPISGSSSIKQYIFPLVAYIYRYSGIVGRGTCVATVLVGIRDAIILANLHALKMSWQYNTRKSEAEILSHLRGALPEYWRKFLPQPVFSAKYTAAQLDLPRSRMRDAVRDTGKITNDDEHVRTIDRDLHVIVNPGYANIWKARNVDEFKKAFLDCLECHYHCYTTGKVLHRDISENNLMIYRPGETDRVPDEVSEQYFVHSGTNAPELNKPQPSHGILNDFDMASMLNEDEAINSGNSHHHHLTGTRPFMAYDLLDAPSSTPTVHLYRHDLESFFYILVWAAAHYKYSRGALVTAPELAKWNGEDAQKLKLAFLFMPPSKSMEYCLPEFSDLWRAWITPLSRMFRNGISEASSAGDDEDTDYDFTTYNGRITFERFMAAIGETPRGLNPDVDTA